MNQNNNKFNAFDYLNKMKNKLNSKNAYDILDKLSLKLGDNGYQKEVDSATDRMGLTTIDDSNECFDRLTNNLGFNSDHVNDAIKNAKGNYVTVDGLNDVDKSTVNDVINNISDQLEHSYY